MTTRITSFSFIGMLLVLLVMDNAVLGLTAGLVYALARSWPVVDAARARSRPPGFSSVSSGPTAAS